MQSVSEPSAKQSQQPKTARPRTGWFRRLLGDIFFVAARDKKLWLLPLIFMLLLLAGLLAIATLAGPLAPFLYPLL
jgi:hypothetical protein